MIKTKSAPKEVKSTQHDNSTMQSPSYFEHVDSLFSSFSSFKISKSDLKSARIRKPSLSPPLPNIVHIEEILSFMHKYIKQIVNVKGDDKCSYCVV